MQNFKKTYLCELAPRAHVSFRVNMDVISVKMLILMGSYLNKFAFTKELKMQKWYCIFRFLLKLKLIAFSMIALLMALLIPRCFLEKDDF